VRALVTGANGFIGSFLCERLRHARYQVRASVRTAAVADFPHDELHISGDLAQPSDWSAALDAVDVVFHVAGVADLIEPAPEAERTMAAVNGEAAASLARAVAAAVHVRRFVLLSSAKVSGETSGDGVWTAADVNPRDAYARSKRDAEEAVRREIDPSRFTIVRTPLVYGPRVRGNVLSLMRHVTWPLPLGSVRNRRSFIFVRNLADVLVWLSANSAAAGGTYFVSDFEDVSTPELIRRMASAVGKSAWLLPVPLWLLSSAAAAVGKRAALAKATGSLRIDTAPVRALGWRPPFSMTEGLLETARWFAAAEGE
jgi:nucleoside-diphosphate-sugar epimerase